MLYIQVNIISRVGMFSWVEQVLSICRDKAKKKVPVFRVTRPYQNLLVKPRIVFRFSEKYIILCILKGEMPLKMHKIIFLPEKKII